MILDLSNITLVVIDCVEPNRAIDAINICKNYANFKEVKFFTHFNLEYNEIINIPKLNKIEEYSNFVLKYLNNFIYTDYVLIAQWDGFILNPEAWTNGFLDFDYIGAPWVMRGRVVGNGGFSLRSKKLLSDVSNILTKYDFKVTMPEDFIISGYLKETLIKNFNIKFAPIELADKFSVEDIGKWTGQFGFHNFNKVDILKDGWIPPKIKYFSKKFKQFSI